MKPASHLPVEWDGTDAALERTFLPGDAPSPVSTYLLDEWARVLADMELSQRYGMKDVRTIRVLDEIAQAEFAG